MTFFRDFAKKQFRPWRLITAAIQPRFSGGSPRFRTCTTSSDDPYSPIGLLFSYQLPTSLSPRPLSVSGCCASQGLTYPAGGQRPNLRTPVQPAPQLNGWGRTAENAFRKCIDSVLKFTKVLPSFARFWRAHFRLY